MAEEQDDASKTEEPTARRLQKGRERGQVAVSQEIKSLGVLAASALALMFMFPAAMAGLTRTGRLFLEQAHAFSIEPGAAQAAMAGLVAAVVWDVALLFGLLVFAAFAASVVQTGLLWAPSKIKPELSKLSLVKGVKRMLSLKALMEFGKGLIKLVVVGLVAFALALPLMADLEMMPAMPLADVLARMHHVAIVMVAATVAVMLAVATVDYLFQRQDHTKQMRMTRQEVRDEHRQAEGDPHVKAKIRQLRQERSRQRMMAAVPDADVVITNPTHFAVALAYDIETMSAPKLVAKGVDYIARNIREVAEEHDVPIVENPPLARALHASVELDEEIPPEHYHAVAQVIGYVMRLKGQAGG
ncbi:MAG: flagellar biosynthesis protein FlhB [Rhodospirillales bacterium]|nr:MAG: flagellar biosynthesis protein FlhB [Rhodospirillales bacterium]